MIKSGWTSSNVVGIICPLFEKDLAKNPPCTPTITASLHRLAYSALQLEKLRYINRSRLLKEFPGILIEILELRR